MNIPHIHPFLSASLLATLLFSCTTDAFDKGEGEYSHMQADMIELHADANKMVDYGDTDEGERLLMAKPFTGTWVTKGDSIYRAYIYYNKEGNKADVISIGSVMVLTPRKEKKPKTDPTGLESIWLSTNRRYLNAALLLKVSYTDNKDERQSLGATIDTLMNNPDGTSTLHLHLYHDQNGMAEYYTQRTYVSIPLSTIETDSVHLSIHTYNGWRERTFYIK